MFRSEELRTMDAAACSARMAEITLKIDQLRSSKHRLSAADEELVTDLADEFRQVNDHRKRLELKRSFAGPDGRAKLNSGGFKMISGADGRDDDDERDHRPTDQLGGLRSTALRTLETSHRRGLLSASGAEVCERMVDQGNGLERSWVSRWITEASSEDYRSALAKVIALGEQSAPMQMSPAERDAMDRVNRLKGERALSLTDSSGGYLVPPELDPVVNITGAGSVSPILQIARVVPTVTDVLHLVSSQGVTASWYAEADEVSDDSPTLGEPTVPNYRMSAWCPFSREVGMDAPTLLSEVSKLLLDGAVQLLNEALINGSGVGQPTGILTALTGSAADNDTAGASFASGDVYATQNRLAPRFQPNASWIANLAVLNTIRQFESSNGARLFPEASANPPQLLGRNLYEASNLSGALTTGEEVSVYGDFSQMVVSQRIGSTIELVPHVFGANRRPTYQSGLFLVGRWGANVITPEAFELLRVQ